MHISRGSALVSVVLATLSLVGILILQAAPARAAATTPDRVKVWTVNMGNLDMSSGNNWKKVIENSMAGHYYKPDIVLVTGLANVDHDGNGTNDTVQFKNALEAEFTGTNYNYRHGDPTNEGNEISNSVVFWRAGRFTLADATTDVVRWQELKGSDCTVRNTPGNTSKYLVGVKLQDTDDPQGGNDRNLVAASVHFDKDYAEQCNKENSTKTNRQLDDLATVRQLTVLGGDFNRHPQPTGSGDCDATGDCDSGRQPNPECWYKILLAPLFHEGNRDCPTNTDTQTYYDTVLLEAERSTSGPDICNQWTHVKDPTPGNACEDRNQNGDRDKSRIDYIWARFETDAGSVRTFGTKSAAFDQIGNSESDQTAPDPSNQSVRYSDHRAVHSIVFWLD